MFIFAKKRREFLKRKNLAESINFFYEKEFTLEELENEPDIEIMGFLTKENYEVEYMTFPHVNRRFKYMLNGYVSGDFAVFRLIKENAMVYIATEDGLIWKAVYNLKIKGKKICVGTDCGCGGGYLTLKTTEGERFAYPLEDRIQNKQMDA